MPEVERWMSKNRSRLHIATELSDSQQDLRQAAPDEHIASEHITQHQIATLAYEYWEQRGRVDGHDEQDWFRAAELNQRQRSTAAMKALFGGPRRKALKRPIIVVTDGKRATPATRIGADVSSLTSVPEHLDHSGPQR